MEKEKTEETKSTNPINQDEIQIYLKDIRKIKVMTPERERFLAERIFSLSGVITFNFRMSFK